MYQCAICTESMLPSEEINSTVCGHMFHEKCLVKWLQKNHTCPQCRKYLKNGKAHIKIYLPPPVSKEDVVERINELAVRNDMLLEEKIKIEKKMKEKRRECKALLNKRKKKEIIVVGDEAALTRAVNEGKTKKEWINVRVDFSRPKPHLTDRRVKRIKRSNDYFAKKKAEKKLKKQKEEEAAAAAAAPAVADENNNA